MVGVKRFKTNNGADGISFKLECTIGQGQYARKQICTAYGSDTIAELGSLNEGRTVKVAGIPKAKCLIGDDGAPFAWIELTGAKLVGARAGHQEADIAPGDIPF